MILTYTSKNFVYIHDVSKMHTSDFKKYRVCQINLNKILELPETQCSKEYENFVMSENGKYIVANNKSLGHLLIIQVNEFYYNQKLFGAESNEEFIDRIEVIKLPKNC